MPWCNSWARHHGCEQPKATTAGPASQWCLHENQPPHRGLVDGRSPTFDGKPWRLPPIDGSTMFNSWWFIKSWIPHRFVGHGHFLQLDLQLASCRWEMITRSLGNVTVTPPAVLVGWDGVIFWKGQRSLKCGHQRKHHPDTGCLVIHGNPDSPPAKLQLHAAVHVGVSAAVGGGFASGAPKLHDVSQLAQGQSHLFDFPTRNCTLPT